MLRCSNVSDECGAFRIDLQQFEANASETHGATSNLAPPVDHWPLLQNLLPRAHAAHINQNYHECDNKKYILSDIILLIKIN